MSLLRLAIRDVLRPVVKNLAGVDVRYHAAMDGNVYPLDGSTIRATLDDAGAESDTADGFTFSNGFVDFKIDVTDLPVMPQALDTIEVVDGMGLATQWFQVLPTLGERAVEALGNFNDAWRIHSKNVPAPEQPEIAYGNSAGDAYGNLDGEGYGNARR